MASSYFKYTLFFEYSSNIKPNTDATPANPMATTRTGGWTESFYNDTDDTNSKQLINELMVRRAALLNRNSLIVGWRISGFETRSGTRTYATTVRGTGPKSEDIPQMALMSTTFAREGNNVMRLILRGISDDWVVGGEISQDADIAQRLNRLYQALSNGNFYQRSRSFVPVPADIETIAADGTFTLVPPGITSLASKKAVYVLKSVSPEHRLKGGLFKLTGTVTDTTGQLFGWDKRIGLDCDGGKMRPAEVVKAQYRNFTDNWRVIPRKIGRAFFVYRGRRSSRR